MRLAGDHSHDAVLRVPAGLQVVWYKFRKSDFKQEGEEEVAEQAEKQEADTPNRGSSHQVPQEDGEVGVVEDSETAAHARSMLKVRITWQ